MRILAVGDLHGRPFWRNIDFNNYEKIVFIGDYVDGYVYRDEEVYDNLTQLIEAKIKYPEKIVLLLGNHDIQYMHYPNYRCSGFRMSMQKQLTAIFDQYKNLFQIAFQLKQYLFTHAGVSSKWYDDLLKYVDVQCPTFRFDQFETLAEALNALDQTLARDMLHQISVYRGGTANHGGVTWADKIELEHPLQGYFQLVGHTPVSTIQQLDIDADTSVTFIDVLGTEEKFYELSIAF
ncbi:metallophosphoesterase [Olivibacter sp. SDN3]|uniref:metallophosphoesterase n=1 Tax=Olivibacter sp. SDN3 TaxID=2764720 RepID=UPI00165107E2|nr:metallophosphoesterase [Olivibacter sp. SDN3]QNL49633.1 metallophosphoesterase [Olivibacter sp. SDN3]